MHSDIRHVHAAARILCGCALAALLVAVPVASHGASSGAITHLAFSGPVSLPGVVLPAGEYTFEAIRSDIVRVSSRDGLRVLYTGFTDRVPRPPALKSDALVTFGESAGGAAPPIREWYPLPTGRGHQFIYR